MIKKVYDKFDVFCRTHNLIIISYKDIDGTTYQNYLYLIFSYVVCSWVVEWYSSGFET